MRIYIVIAFLFVIKCSMSQSMQGNNQFERKYIISYDWNNVTLTLYSNSTFLLTSLWNVNMNEDEIPENSLIIWSKGEYHDSNGMVICTDFTDLRKLVLSKNNSSDTFKIIDCKGFQELSNKNNFHKGWEYKNDSIIFIGNLLNKETCFYIHSERLFKTNEHDSRYTLYKWENGEKKIVYQISQDEDNCKYKLPWIK